MLRSLTIPVAALTFLSAPVTAGSEPVTALIDAMRLPEVIAIMRAEGIDYGEEIGAGLLPRAARSGWVATVERIYSESRMIAQFETRFVEELVQSGQPVEPMVDFFTSELGSTVIGLEISARSAMLDEEIDEAAKLMLGDLMAGEDPRIEQLRRFVDANDLLEENVVGGLNSTYAFYMGLVESGAPGFDLDESEILADVWAQEPEIRDDLEEWLFAYLALAYRPLEPEDLDAYIEFSETDAGQAMNAALFTAFSAMFTSISGELGREAGRALSAEDI